MKLGKIIDKMVTKNEFRGGGDLGMSHIKEVLSEFFPSKPPSTTVGFPREITLFRSFIYSLVCGNNNKEITK
jgi:hypothetical protein